MKKISLILGIGLLFLTASCGGDKTEEITTNTEKAKYVLLPTSTSVHWTAYKTSEKLPVGGEFQTVDFAEKQGNNAQEALDGLEFTIPVSSLFTKDEGRDKKLKETFFGNMTDTELLKGKIHFKDGTYSATLTMNGVSNELPLEVMITDETDITIKGLMQLKEWNALGALEKLNTICKDLHTGADGVSKTWEEVAIEVKTTLNEN